MGGGGVGIIATTIATPTNNFPINFSDPEFHVEGWWRLVEDGGGIHLSF